MSGWVSFVRMFSHRCFTDRDLDLLSYRRPSLPNVRGGVCIRDRLPPSPASAIPKSRPPPPNRGSGVFGFCRIPQTPGRRMLFPKILGTPPSPLPDRLSPNVLQWFCFRSNDGQPVFSSAAVCAISISPARRSYVSSVCLPPAHVSRLFARACTWVL